MTGYLCAQTKITKCDDLIGDLSYDKPTLDDHSNAHKYYDSPAWPCLTIAVRMPENPSSQERPSLLVRSVSDQAYDMEQNSSGVYLKAI